MELGENENDMGAVDYKPQKMLIDDRLSKYTEVDFPTDAFPNTIKDLSKHLEETIHAPYEMLSFCSLGIIAGIAGYYYKLVGAVDRQTQTANLYLLGSGGSSQGKSIALKPLSAFLEDEQGRWIKQYREERKTNPDAISPMFIFSNSTSEALAKRMGEVDAPLFSLDAEAGEILDIITGKYNKNNITDADFYNRAWSIESYSGGRVHSGDFYIQKPCLSSLWLTQPYKIRQTIVSKESLKDSGFVGRLIMFGVDVQMQEDKGNVPKENPQILEKWNYTIGRLLETRRNKSFIEICADDEAKEVFRLFHNEIVRALGGDLRGFEALLGKSREKACRVALNFAICDGVKRVNEQTAKNACDIIRYSNAKILELYSSGYAERVEKIKATTEDFFKERGVDVLTVSELKRNKRIELDELNLISSHYPDLFSVEKVEKGKGYIIMYKGEFN